MNLQTTFKNRLLIVLTDNMLTQLKNNNFYCKIQSVIEENPSDPALLEERSGNQLGQYLKR